MTIETRHRMSGRLAGAVLVCAIVAVATVTTPASADPLTCGAMAPDFDFSPSDSAAFACQTVAHTYLPGDDVSNLYGFAPFAGGFSFTNELTFDTVLREFTLYLTAFFIEPGTPEFLSRIPSAYEPETFVTTLGLSWVYFYVEDLIDETDEKPQQGADYLGNWAQDIRWYGDGEYNDPQVLHDPRGDPNFFGNVITVPGSFDPELQPECSQLPCDPCPECGCEICDDPVIIGTANDFSGTTIASTRVPEPAAMWMVGLGAVATVTRVRQLVRRGRRGGGRYDPGCTSR